MRHTPEGIRLPERDDRHDVWSLIQAAAVRVTYRAPLDGWEPYTAVYDVEDTQGWSTLYAWCKPRRALAARPWTNPHRVRDRAAGGARNGHVAAVQAAGCAGAARSERRAARPRCAAMGMVAAGRPARLCALMHATSLWLLSQPAGRALPRLGGCTGQASWVGARGVLRVA